MGCSFICQKSVPVLPGAIVQMPGYEEAKRQRELCQAEDKKLQAVPVLSIDGSSLYNKRKSQVHCDDTKDFSF